MSQTGPAGRRLVRPGRTRLAGAPAARTPFVLLMVALLATGLLVLLLLNATVNQGSFELSDLERRAGELRDQRQHLQAEIDDRSAPEALERRARQLGLVPGGAPAFLAPDGTVRGVPSPAASPQEER